MSTSAKKSYDRNWPAGKSYGGTGSAPDASGSGMDKCSKADQDRMTEPAEVPSPYSSSDTSSDAG
jgi:hypothetical protein